MRTISVVFIRVLIIRWDKYSWEYIRQAIIFEEGHYRGNYQRAIILRATLIGCNYPESNYPDTGVFKYLQHDLLYHFDLFYFFKLEKKGNKPKRRNATKKVSRVASLLLLLNKFLIVSSREVTETHQSSPQMLIHNTWRQNQEGEKQNSLINAFV